MNKITLFHGSSAQNIHPQFAAGNEKRDFGKGFYMTADRELAREWSAARPTTQKGYVCQFELDLADLKILDFQKMNPLFWLAELMKHRTASDSKRYRILAKYFIDTYAIDTSDYDVIKGWRADASYFLLAKAFAKDEVDVSILDEILKAGEFETEYCLKSEKAFQHLKSLSKKLEMVNASFYQIRYNQRDMQARMKIKSLIDSDVNTVTNVFSTLGRNPLKEK
ncbi:DUF3990 domain-containing protein [Erysipelotrichaceae bacterium RD49]|nr:DUF3990 domain-containing protein [Erysipelotrichaceae bacterium RD49]